MLVNVDTRLKSSRVFVLSPLNAFLVALSVCIWQHNHISIILVKNGFNLVFRHHYLCLFQSIFIMYFKFSRLITSRSILSFSPYIKTWINMMLHSIHIDYNSTITWNHECTKWIVKIFQGWMTADWRNLDSLAHHI